MSCCYGVGNHGGGPTIENINLSLIHILKKEFGVPVMLQNDADACALAEWSMGAGKGCKNMIFLTFGTGMGCLLYTSSFRGE